MTFLANAGYTEVVQLLIGRATDAECVKRMLDTVDAEGDTVSASNLPFFGAVFLFPCKPG